MNPLHIPRTNRSLPFSLFEKIALLFALFLFVGGLAGFFYDRAQSKTEQPVIGGTYTEGVIADSPTKVERVVNRLTNIGLTYRDKDGAIKPALAASWEVTNDNKVYTFALREGYDAASLLSIITNSKTNWTGVKISAPDASHLRFELNEPLSLFLSTTTQPLFPYGPYEVVKRDKRETLLRANSNFVLGEPYISKFVIKQYDSHDTLLRAAQEGEINGSADFVKDIPRKFTKQTVPLPRYYVLFLNVTRPSLKKLEERQRVTQVKNGDPLTYSLVTSQTGVSGDLADTLAKEMAAAHMTVTVQKKNSVTIQKEDIPKREFDLLLYGVDYGIDRDYYPFWHSSQVASPGLNISGVKDKSLDSLLEQARREPDSTKRHEITKQIEQHLEAHALQKILSQETFQFWMDSSVRGTSYGTMNEGIDRFQLVWQWYAKSKMVRK